MCGRTSLFVPEPRVEARFDATAVESLEPRYNVAPRDDLAVIRDDAPGAIHLDEWGLVPDWTDDPGADRFINARAETVEEKPSFADAVAERRCLVLADGFYEWQDRTTGSQPYRVQRADGEPFAMAGLYERHDGDPTVAVLTAEPNAVVEPLHHRMAVVLPAGREREWLSAEDPDDRADLLATPDPDPWERFPVTDRVGDPSYDDPVLVEPVDAPEEDPQTGLGDFG